MPEKYENIFRETEAAFGFAALLLNFLIFAAVFGFVWLMRLLIAPSNSFGAALGEAIWR